MKKRTILFIALCLALSYLSACTRQPVSQQDAVQRVRDDTIDTPTDAQKTQDEQDPPAPAKEKTVLKLGGVGCAESKIKMVINEFNKTDSDYTVSLTDYGYGVTADQGKMQLQTQMIAGNRPDMLLFDNEVISSGNRADALSPLAYIAADSLVDLDEFVQADPELSAEDFIIWDALHEFDGMYVVGPKFWVHALVCRPDVAEQYRNWTLNDYITLQDTLNSNQKMMYYITPEWFIRNVGSRYLHEAIDTGAAACDFENPDFIGLLEAALQIQTSIAEGDHMQEDGSFKSAPEMLMDGDIMFAREELRSAYDVSFDRYRSGGIRAWYGEGDSPYQDKTGGTETMGYIGYPTPDGSNGMYVELPYAVSICAGTEKADGCWEFIRFMLKHPMYQDQIDGTPVLASMLQDNLQCIASYTSGGKWKTEEKDQKVLVEAARTCDTMSFYDEDILQIVEEEAAEVLAGKMTAEEAAQMIQNRASVLVMERYG